MFIIEFDCVMSWSSHRTFFFVLINTQLENVLEAPPFIQSSIDMSDKYVIVEALASVSDASWVELEPETTQDWELIEIFAETLEAGSLLGQISVVYPGQRFSLLLGSDRAQVVVKNFGVTTEEDTRLPSCLRLISDTEVMIIPKPRMETFRKDYAPSQPLRIIPNEADFSPSMKKLHRLLLKDDVFDEFIPCPPFFTASIHFDSLTDIQGWDDVHDKNEHTYPSAFAELRQDNRNRFAVDKKEKDSALVQIVPSKIVPIGCIGESLFVVSLNYHIFYGTSP